MIEQKLDHPDVTGGGSQVQGGFTLRAPSIYIGSIFEQSLYFFRVLPFITPDYIVQGWESVFSWPASRCAVAEQITDDARINRKNDKTGIHSASISPMRNQLLDVIQMPDYL